MQADRQAILAAIDVAGDAGQGDAARTAALAAHEGQRSAWHTLVGDLLYTATTEGATRLTQAWQAAGADLGDYDTAGEALAQWIASRQTAWALAVYRHTHGMLADALADALITPEPNEPSEKSRKGAISWVAQQVTNAVNNLFDQWIGATNAGDYAGQFTDDLVAEGWNAGEQDAADQATADGQVGAQKQWQTVGDDRVRPAHDDADGQTVNADEPFVVDGEELMYPCDPEGSLSNTSGCRCSAVWTLTSDASSATASGGSVMANGDA